ncbi:MAG: cytochrome c biogenesis protein CcdA [Planctomycetota bacterium]
MRRNACSCWIEIRFVFLGLALIALASTTCRPAVAQPPASQLARQDSEQLDDVTAIPEFEFETSFSMVKGKRIGQLDVTLFIADGLHGYSQSDLPGQLPTKIVVTPDEQLISVGEFIPDRPPQRKTSSIGVTEEYEDQITWSARIEIAKDVIEQELQIGMVVSGQVCNEEKCTQFDRGENELVAEFHEYLTVQPVPLSGSSIANASSTLTQSQLLTCLGMALLAGLILNAMPCVLPVIGLKVMAFVKQAGENRLRIFLLNMAFSAGLMLVFLIVATLAAFFGMGWGDWLTKSIPGSVIITSVVFAFGLSMLGIWEIPIPGLGANSKEEGLWGAFLLGILTTVLATPCTGPMLVPATAIVVGQPAWVAYLVFTCLGLGMALPYLLIGIFPILIHWLPKPGPWMDTFKQVTGFVLLGTVVFLLSGFSGEPRSKYLVPTLATLLAIGFGCWWIGSASYSTDARKRRSAWIWGITMIAAGAIAAFLILGPPRYELEWKNFSITQLNEKQAANQFVFVDFTGPN